uniref:uncharacterized protein tp53i13 n=1 Tax=Semicossyphus pulcher TaxID=241346 RepID=UPI0037E91B75
MPSQTSSPPLLTVTLLVALWVRLGRCGVPESRGPQCDNGKLSLDRDLPAGAIYRECPVTSWPESPQRLPSIIDTLYDPEPANQICMGKSISYNHTIPNSGAYRPVRAESGEYLYCPPQRWLNNLHHAAIVLLYHPCVPLHERLLLSVLARSCLPDYIITPHTQLNKHTPIVLVSWGRTLELSTMATLDVCVWLERTTSTRSTIGDVSQSMNYNLLLTWSAEKHREQPAYSKEHPARIKESLRQCCEQTISSLLNGVMEPEVESNTKKESLKQQVKVRHIRAIRGGKKSDMDKNEKENTIKRVSRFLSNQTNRTHFNRTVGTLNYISTLRSSANSQTENRTLAYVRGPNEAPSQLEIQNINQSLRPMSTVPLGSNMPETALRTDSFGFGDPESQRIRLMLPTSVPQPSPRNIGTKPLARLDILAASVNSKRNHTARLETLAISSKEVTNSTKQRDKHPMKDNASKIKHSDKANTADGMMKGNEVVDVKETELEQRQTHNDTHPPHKSEKTGFDSVSKSQTESPPLSQLYPLPASNLPKRNDCEGCKKGEHCECTKDSLAEAQAAFVNKGLPRTPRTDEAVWAAAALGFLLVLLTLSVLHTRLYRHWRTTPSLYWHDPKQDYDSVADVIRGRIRIAKRRQKRSRRRECVLLPSSSSSDENP